MEVSFGNVQLLTPSKLNILDAKLPQLQYKSFMRDCGGTKEITLKDGDGNEKKIFVKFSEPYLFNFGSNAFHFMGWIRAIGDGFEKINGKSFERILGKDFGSIKQLQTFSSIDKINIEKCGKMFSNDSLVHGYLADPTNSDGDKKTVIQLALQICHIFNSDQQNKNVADFFCIQSRALLLMHKLGIATSFNCKSGKDRTGMCNVTIDLLIAQMEKNNGIVPPPYAPLDEDIQRVALEIFDKSGSLEIAYANTGNYGLNLSNPGDLFADSNMKIFGETRGSFIAPRTSTNKKAKHS
jgi:hypothetical protein